MMKMLRSGKTVNFWGRDLYIFENVYKVLLGLTVFLHNVASLGITFSGTSDKAVSVN